MKIFVTRPKTFVLNSAAPLTIYPTGQPKDVPDWVRDTNTFKTGITDQSVLELQVKAPAPPTVQAALEAANVEVVPPAPEPPTPARPVKAAR